MGFRKFFSRIVLILFLSVFLIFGNAVATNITIDDGNGYTGSGVGYEVGETEPGMVNSLIWDLQSFHLDGTTLTMAGGYNFEDGEVSGRTNPARFYSGDIFIGLGTVLYGAGAGNISDDNSTRNSTMSNMFGYDYAIDLDFLDVDDDGDTYSVYAIDDTTEVETSFFYDYGDNDLANQASNPVSVANYNGLTKVGGGQLVLSEINSIYSLSVDLDFLGAGSDFYAHFTMECGNDNLMGHGTTPVPEPATMFLFGTGLIGLAGFGRKKLISKS